MTKDQYTAFLKLAEQVERERHEQFFGYEARERFYAEERAKVRKELGYHEVEEEQRRASQIENDLRDRLREVGLKVEAALSPKREEWQQRERQQTRAFVLAKAELLAAATAEQAKAIIECQRSLETA